MTIMMTMVTLTIGTLTMAIMVFLAMVITDHGTVYCLYFSMGGFLSTAGALVVVTV